MKRRNVILGSAAVAASAYQFSNAQTQPALSVGVIGATGRGNYGHGLDKVWLQMPETSIFAVADADEKGLAKARKTLKVERGFADYRKMLAEVKPTLVAVCPRHPDQHAEMILAAIENGALGIYVEKPFVRTLEEADQIDRAAREKGTRIAIAHRNRYHPDLAAIDKILANQGEQKIGKLLEIRGRGKGDRRGGGEDLWVLGTHVLNLINYFGGAPVSCSAEIFTKGKKATEDDIYPGNEALGPLVGDEIHARFEMSRGIPAFFDSQVNDGTKNRGFGLQLIGSEGTVIMHCDAKPLAHYRAGNPLDPTNKNTWIPIGNEDLETINQVHNHVVPCRDLIQSIEQFREPICGLKEGITTVEMVMGGFASHQEGGKSVSFPLKTRSHPLEI